MQCPAAAAAAVGLAAVAAVVFLAAAAVAGLAVVAAATRAVPIPVVQLVEGMLARTALVVMLETIAAALTADAVTTAAGTVEASTAVPITVDSMAATA